MVCRIRRPDADVARSRKVDGRRGSERRAVRSVVRELSCHPGAYGAASGPDTRAIHGETEFPPRTHAGRSAMRSTTGLWMTVCCAGEATLGVWGVTYVGAGIAGVE